MLCAVQEHIKFLLWEFKSAIFRRNRPIFKVLMSDVAEHGTTVLVSSHNLTELEDVCDHVGIMHHGKVMLERSLSELQGSVCKIHVASITSVCFLEKERSRVVGGIASERISPAHHLDDFFSAVPIKCIPIVIMVPVVNRRSAISLS